MLSGFNGWRASLCVLALSMSMCTTERTGTETDNPVVDFDATECKAHGTALTLATVARTAAAQEVDPSAYDGLYCYAWETLDDGRLSIDVINFSGGCHVPWKLGASRVDGAHIELGVASDFCGESACGSCAYDFTFEIDGVDLSEPAEVRLRQYDCHGGGDFEPEPSVVLPLDGEPSGIVCRMQNGVGMGERCGGAHLPPCADDGDVGRCADGCGEGLTCIEGGDAPDLCFTACNEDADCPIEIDSCQDGACRLRETF